MADLKTAPALSILEQRRIEASLIKPFLAALVTELGAERAMAMVRSVVEGIARQHGHTLRPTSPPGITAIARAWEGFAAGGALDVERLEQSAKHLRIRVT